MNDDPAFKILMANAEAMKRGALPVWTIFDRPKDYPRGFIARRSESGKGGIVVTDEVVVGSLEEIRALFERAGLYKLVRDASDDPKIVEKWI